MNVLVAYASRHGSTREIAGRIADDLRRAGLSVDLVTVTEVKDLEGYDAFVVGSAAYMFHWMKEATAFVKRHRKVLADKPLWLFSSGPLGTDLVDAEGNEVLEVSRPREFDEFGAIHPRGEKVFFGAWDPQAPPIGMAEKVLRRMAGSNETLPAGDFRDWPAIDDWAAEIALELRSLQPTPSGRQVGD